MRVRACVRVRVHVCVRALVRVEGMCVLAMPESKALGGKLNTLTQLPQLLEMSLLLANF